MEILSGTEYVMMTIGRLKCLMSPKEAVSMGGLLISKACETIEKKCQSFGKPDPEVDKP